MQQAQSSTKRKLSFLSIKYPLTEPLPLPLIVIVRRPQVHLVPGDPGGAGAGQEGGSWCGLLEGSELIYICVVKQKIVLQHSQYFIK